MSSGFSITKNDSSLLVVPGCEATPVFKLLEENLMCLANQNLELLPSL